MQEDSPEPERQEVIRASHHDAFYKSNPGWTTVPELNDEARQKVSNSVVEIVPGILENGASRRCEVLKTLGCQYVRYRRAGCTAMKSRSEAIKRTRSKHDLGKSAVYEHIRALPIEGSSEISPYLEQINTVYHRSLPEIARAFQEPCQKLIRVLSVIAGITEAPGLGPSDITLRDVYRDQPGERNRVLTADHQVVGLPAPEHDNRGASVRMADMGLNREELEVMSRDNPIHLTDNAKVTPRDISTYDTEYSQVLREIFEASQAEMELYGKQKPAPRITSERFDNAAVRAVIPYPKTVNAQGENFVWFEVQYWLDGSSIVNVRTQPLGRAFDEKDPSLSGPIEKISEPGIYALIGKTMDIAEQANTSRHFGSSF